jgi:hypothetical protein
MRREIEKETESQGLFHVKRHLATKAGLSFCLLNRFAIDASRAPCLTPGAAISLAGAP